MVAPSAPAIRQFRSNRSSVRIVARQRGADRLVGVGDHDREAVQVVDHPLVPGPVDRQLEVGGRDVPNDPQVVN